MKSVYLREQRRYSQSDLSNIFALPESKTVAILRRLKEYGVLKAVRATTEQYELSDLVEEDIELADIEVGEDEYLYVVTFVGIIVVEGIVLKCYPKYLLHSENPQTELKQILKVLEKYNSKEQIIRMYNDSDTGSAFNMLAVILYLLQDYYEYGIYTNMQNVIETNGSGEILWDKTINETFTLISAGRPYYPELLTRKRVSDEYDFFKRLHECILTGCGTFMNDSELLELFDMEEVELSEEKLYDLGDIDYILDRLSKELSVQFNTRKQLLLKTMYAFVAHSNTLNDIECFSTFGTNSFNLVWESVCVDVMDNQLQKPLDTLKLPVPLSEGYGRNAKLIELIEKPLWSVTGQTSKDTLIPDLVTITDGMFVIFDAKYYNAYLEPNRPPKGQPGIESVTKQYLYQLAYMPFVNAHDIKDVYNCFLLPTESHKVIDKGYVSLDMLRSIGLKDILVRLVPADMMFRHYIEGTKMNIHDLKLQ